MATWPFDNIISTRTMFLGAPLYDGAGLGSRNVANVFDMTSMLIGSGITTPNLDAIYIGWNSLPSLQNNVPFGASAQYSAGTAATARAIIIANFNWTIVDD